jgi:hypothetical protein
MRARPITMVSLVALIPAAAAADTTHIYHVPPAEAADGVAFPIEATIDRAWEASLQLKYRAIGGRDWHSEAFQRSGEEAHFLATVPPDYVKPPGFEYYIVGTDKAGAGQAHFASEVDPHQVSVPEKADAVLRNQELARVGNRRARVRFAGEYVDFGSRNIAGMDIRDYYYRIDADFTYRLLQLPLYQLRFGGTRLIGLTPATSRDDGTCDPDREDVAGTCRGRAGISVAGWAETRLRLNSLIDADLRGIVAATKTGFSPGGRLEMRAGPESGSHVAVGIEYLPETGFNAWVRLAWDTVPHFPMAATIEITDYPASHRATAVRLIYDLAYPLKNGLRVGLRGGYQARDEGIGGPTAGGNLALEF